MEAADLYRRKAQLNKANKAANWLCARHPDRPYGETVARALRAAERYDVRWWAVALGCSGAGRSSHETINLTIDELRRRLPPEKSGEPVDFPPTW